MSTLLRIHKLFSRKTRAPQPLLTRCGACGYQAPVHSHGFHFESGGALQERRSPSAAIPNDRCADRSACNNRILARG